MEGTGTQIRTLNNPTTTGPRPYTTRDWRENGKDLWKREDETGVGLSI